MLRIEMLNEDESHAGIDRQRIQELGKRFQSAC